MADESAAPPPAAKPKPPRRLLQKQAAMRRMCMALAPIGVAGIYFFGWRVLALVAACTLVGLASEWWMTSRRGRPVSEACFVTCLLYALSLPPTLPFWMAAVGMVVAILFGKEVYGGFGRNWCNPAIVGRAFVYVAFPVEMTGSFVPAFRGFPGGFGRWSLAGMGKVPAWLASGAETMVDAVTAATPMWTRRDFGHAAGLGDLFFGTIGGTFPTPYGTHQVLAAGSVGEVCAPLILLAGVYLLLTRTANWQLMLGPFVGAALAVLLFRHLGGSDGVPGLGFTLCSGAFLYGAVFMVTEPVSAPKKTASVWIYGMAIGFLIVLLRWKAQFAGAVAFSILMGNILGPSVDMAVVAWQQRGKAAEAPAAKGEA